MHPGEATLFVMGARRAAGLVVGDDELALGIEFEPIDDSAQAEFAGGSLGRSSSPMSRTDFGSSIRRYESTRSAASLKKTAAWASLRCRFVKSGSARYSTIAVASEVAAASAERSFCASMNNNSSARCTSEPRVAGMLGGSGSFSILAKRKAIGQDRNDSTRLGDRLVGTGNMPPS